MAQKIPPIPSPDEAFLLRNGTINPVWYEWFHSLQKILITSGILHYDFEQVDIGAINPNATFQFNATTKKFDPL